MSKLYIVLASWQFDFPSDSVVNIDIITNIANYGVEVKSCIQFGVSKLCVREFRLEKFGLYHIKGKL